MEVIIIGCSRVGAELARILSGEGHNVVVVDKSADSFQRLGETFNGATLVGNGIDLDTLKKANIENADTVAVVTNGDNTNLMAAQVARKIFHVPKVIVRVYDPRRANLYRQWGLDILSGTTLVASMMRDRIIESKLSGYLIETSELGTLEVEAPQKYIGKKVSKVNIPEEFIVVSIVSKSGTNIPSVDTIIHKGDRLIGVVKMGSLQKVRKLLELK